MTEEDIIWHSLYDKGINKGVDDFNDKQRDLFYYIDFIYQIEMDGSAGFVYNQSPTQKNENFYQPYIQSWKRFEMDSLIGMINHYNIQYQKALERYELNGNRDFEIFEKEYDLKNIAESLYSVIDDAYKKYKDQRTAEVWINQNRNELNINLTKPDWL